MIVGPQSVRKHRHDRSHTGETAYALDGSRCSERPDDPATKPVPPPPGPKSGGGGGILAKLGVVGGATLAFLVGPLADPAGDPYSCYDVNCGLLFGYEVDWDKVGHGQMRVSFTTFDLLDAAGHGHRDGHGRRQDDDG